MPRLLIGISCRKITQYILLLFVEVYNSRDYLTVADIVLPEGRQIC